MKQLALAFALLATPCQAGIFFEFNWTYKSEADLIGEYLEACKRFPDHCAYGPIDPGSFAVPSNPAITGYITPYGQIYMRER